MAKRVFAIIISVAYIISMGGCGVDFYAGRRPGANADERWVSVSPEMYFTWVEDSGHLGAITLAGSTMAVCVCFDYGTGMDVFPYDSEAKAISGTTYLFRCDCKFGENILIATVTRDEGNIFGGELPVITFERERLEGEDTELLSPRD